MWFAEKEGDQSMRPRAVLQGCAFAYDPSLEKVFLYGGRSNQPQPRVLAFDMKKSCWEDTGYSSPTASSHSMPSLVTAGPSLHSHVLVLHNSTTVFVHGGKDQYDRVNSSLFAHHVEIGSWECLDGHVGGCQAPAMYGHSSIQIAPDTYLFVGIAEGRKRQRHERRAAPAAQASLSVYKLSLQPQPVWEQIVCTGDLPPSRRNFSLAYRASSNCAVLVGGRFGQAIMNDIWSLDLKTNRWAQMTMTPKNLLSKERGVLGASAIFVGDRLFVIDGNEWAEFDAESGRRKCLRPFQVRSSRILYFIAPVVGDRRAFLRRKSFEMEIDAAFVGVSAAGDVFRGVTIPESPEGEQLATAVSEHVGESDLACDDGLLAELFD